MKMFLKLAYLAFSSSPSKDATRSTFWGFSSLLLKLKLLDEVIKRYLQNIQVRFNNLTLVMNKNSGKSLVRA